MQPTLAPCNAVLVGSEYRILNSVHMVSFQTPVSPPHHAIPDAHCIFHPTFLTHPTTTNSQTEQQHSPMQKPAAANMDTSFMHPDVLAFDWSPDSFVLDMYETAEAEYPVKVDLMEWIAETPDPSIMYNMDQVRIYAILVLFKCAHIRNFSRCTYVHLHDIDLCIYTCTLL